MRCDKRIAAAGRFCFDGFTHAPGGNRARCAWFRERRIVAGSMDRRVFIPACGEARAAGRSPRMAAGAGTPPEIADPPRGGRGSAGPRRRRASGVLRTSAFFVSFVSVVRQCLATGTARRILGARIPLTTPGATRRRRRGAGAPETWRASAGRAAGHMRERDAAQRRRRDPRHHMRSARGHRWEAQPHPQARKPRS